MTRQSITALTEAPRRNVTNRIRVTGAVLYVSVYSRLQFFSSFRQWDQIETLSENQK